MKRQVKIWRFKQPYIIAKHGLFGKEVEVLKAMFSEDGKTTLKFERLNSLQKKVLRKMKYPKNAFIQPSN